MNVTFLIGNGFDIACGLNTSYTDFVNYYLAVPNDNKNITFFKGIIAQELDTWADAEIAFGKYTEHYKIEEVSAFRECRDDFITELVLYLGRQENRIDMELLKLSTASFLNGLINFDYYLPNSSKDILIEYYNEKQIGKRDINILTFNYTNLFEEILNQLVDGEGFIRYSKLLNGQECENHFGKLLYVHGKRDNSPIIFGVDNEDQIINKELFNDPMFELSILKPKINDELDKKKAQQCMEIIRKSSVICIYGMSIGLTDTIWWRAIVDWLKRDRSHYLIYHAWSKNCVRDSASNYLESLQDCRRNTYNKLMLSEDDLVLLRDQIHIEVNMDLFGVHKNIASQIVEPPKIKVFNHRALIETP